MQCGGPRARGGVVFHFDMGRMEVAGGSSQKIEYWQSQLMMLMLIKSVSMIGCLRRTTKTSVGVKYFRTNLK